MAPTVDVKLTGPTQATVGGQVTFDIVVTNHSQAAATGLVITDRFDEGLEHALAKTEEAAVRKIERDLGDLAPGQWQRLTVTFHVTRPGRLSHTVEVKGDNGIQASAQASLTAVEPTSARPQSPLDQSPPVSVNKSIMADDGSPATDAAGLPSRRVGQIVRFLIEVTNNSTEPLQDLTLVDRYDPSLVQVAASDGYRYQSPLQTVAAEQDASEPAGQNPPPDNALTWTIDSLPAGATTRFKVHCRCLKVAAKARNQAVVTTPDGQHFEDDVYLEIRPTLGGLAVTAVDLRDPVAVGRGTTYEIQVTNQADAPHQDVAVVATVPVGMMPDRLGTSGPAKPNIQGQVIRFQPVAELPTGQTLTYRVRVQTRQVGEVTFRAEVTSRDQPQPLTAEETTEVVQ